MFALSLGFQNGMSWPHCTKTHKLVRVLGNGPFPDQGPVGGANGAGSPTQQYDLFAEQTLKTSVYFMQWINNSQTIISAQTYSRREEGLLEQLQVDWKLAQSAAQRENERSATWRRRLEGDVRSGIAKEKSSHWTFDAGEWVTKISENKTFYLLTLFYDPFQQIISLS